MKETRIARKCPVVLVVETERERRALPAPRMQVRWIAMKFHHIDLGQR